ncbi:hypothetical protein V1478_006741 [Vespula squamosa]|uniref:Uncharacterized protein n=1 Tax=Vespula squamosa TaxID=30214 RepID=A0ABD2B0S9_VESSQ
MDSPSVNRSKTYLPGKKTFQRLDERLRDTNSFKRLMLGVGKSVNVRTVNLEESLRKSYKNSRKNSTGSNTTWSSKKKEKKIVLRLDGSYP